MEKVWKRLIAVSLSLMLMFTMGTTVFATEGVGEQQSDDSTATLNESETVSEGDALDADSPLVESDAQESETAASTDLQEENADVKALAGTTTQLTLVNNTGMFKAHSASLAKTGTTSYLVVALTGTGYHYLYKGTFEQAVANGDNRDEWIAGYENDEGKWEFQIPVGDNESYIPIVSISQSYLSKYENGQVPLQRAFYPRQFEIDRTAKTLTTDDYHATSTVDVINCIKMFKPAAEAQMSVVGGINSNNYSVKLTLPMESDSFSKVKAATYTVDTGVITPGDEIEIEIDGNTTFADIPVIPGETNLVQFWSVKNEKYYDRYLTVDLLNNTIVFTSTPEEAEKATAFANATIAPLDDVTYNGEEWKPELSISLDGTDLVVDVDYTVEYSNNVDAGIAKIIVKGKGEYLGGKTAKFVINPAAQKLNMSTKLKTVKYKKLRKKAQTTSKVAVSGAETKVTYAKVSGSKKLKINKTTGKITVAKKTKKGTYKIRVKATAAKSNNYNAATVTKTIKVKVK